MRYYRVTCKRPSGAVFVGTYLYAECLADALTYARLACSEPIVRVDVKLGKMSPWEIAWEAGARMYLVNIRFREKAGRWPFNYFCGLKTLTIQMEAGDVMECLVKAKLAYPEQDIVSVSNMISMRYRSTYEGDHYRWYCHTLAFHEDVGVIP